MSDTLFNVPLYRERIRTTIYGARLALDDDNVLVGPVALKRRVSASITTTVPTSAYNHGVTRIGVTGSTQGPTQHAMAAPMVGVTATFVLVSTSTGSQQFLMPSGVTIQPSSGTTIASTVLNALGGQGASITLIGLSTSQWGVFARSDLTSTAGTSATAFSFTTST